MTHHHDNSPLVGAVLGAIGGAYKTLTTSMAVITFSGLLEASVYAVVGAAFGAITSFAITHYLKKLFKQK